MKNLYHLKIPTSKSKKFYGKFYIVKKNKNFNERLVNFIFRYIFI